ncbi:MAG: glycosyltransferase family 2 protein [Pseudomonadota bacterium]
MAAPRVSVVMLTYNNSNTLARSLESIAAQDYPNYHVVAVDDCSTDDSVAIAEQFAARYPLIRSFKNPHNFGLVKNFASADRFIEGEYFLLGGPDDTWAPDFLSRMVAALEANPRASAALSSVNSLFDDGESTIFRYSELHRIGVGHPVALATRILNGVLSDGTAASLYNSFFACVARSKHFRATFPDNPTFWYVELQIVLMLVLLGGLTTVDDVLYTRHRFRASWEERYPDDGYVPLARRPWSRFKSACSFLVHALRRPELSFRAKLAVPVIFLEAILFQSLRPALGSFLRRALPDRFLQKVRALVYKFVSSPKGEPHERS